MNAKLWMSLLLALAPIVTRGEIIFSQTFSPAAPISTYVNSTSPDSGQWNKISGATVDTTGLTFARGGNFTRSTDFSPTPPALIYRFDVSVSGSSTALRPAAVFQVGANFSPDAATAESDWNVHSQFGLNLAGTSGGYSFRNMKTSENSSVAFNARNTITWVINNSGSSLQYLAPNNTIQTVANDTWDLWCGYSSVFNDVPANTGSVPLTDMKFVFSGSGTITLDNFELVQPVPEPASAGLMGVLFIVLAISGSSLWRARKRLRYRRVSFVRTWARRA